MKVLITGFDPFGGEKMNPAYEAVKLLPDVIDGKELVKREIPTVFGRAGDVLKAAIDEVNPDAVILVGQAGGRCAITIEKVAINYMEASIEDNDGNKPHAEAVVEGGPVGYFTSLPILSATDAMNAAGIPSSVSYSAGTYVCNYLFYTLKNYLEEKGMDIPSGFVHVPYCPEQTAGKMNQASMPLEMIAKGLEILVKEL